MSLGFISKNFKFTNELKIIYNPSKKLKEIRPITCDHWVYSVAVSN